MNNGTSLHHSSAPMYLLHSFANVSNAHTYFEVWKALNPKQPESPPVYN
jgi:hypothetical protein